MWKQNNKQYQKAQKSKKKCKLPNTFLLKITFFFIFCRYRALRFLSEFFLLLYLFTLLHKINYFVSNAYFARATKSNCRVVELFRSAYKCALLQSRWRPIAPTELCLNGYLSAPKLQRSPITLPTRYQSRSLTVITFATVAQRAPNALSYAQWLLAFCARSFVKCFNTPYLYFYFLATLLLWLNMFQHHVECCTESKGIFGENRVAILSGFSIYMY